MADASSPPPSPPTRSRRRTLLLALVALLLVALAAEAVYALTRPEPTATAERPVVLAPVTASAAVRAAAGSTAEILSYGFEDLEAQVEAAASRMTPEFAAQFRRRVLAGQESLVAQRATQEAEVLEAGVVSATPSQVEALVFLDRRVAKAGEGTTVRPYRVLVTVVRRGGVWLVSDIETR